MVQILQCVVSNNEKSSSVEGKTAVPQTSVLGSLPFSLYINDLPELCLGADFQMYADDTVIYCIQQNYFVSFHPAVAALPVYSSMV